MPGASAAVREPDHPTLRHGAGRSEPERSGGRRFSLAVVAFAITCNAAAIALSLAGKMNPLLAAVLMPASSLASLAIVMIGLRRAA